jgi:uncharacterized protein (DUF58 family)
MGFRNIFTAQPKSAPLPLFDETFVRRLERLSFRTFPRLRGVMPGERRSRNLRPALDFSDHRPYTHGDDLRHVDWNAYGRQEDLFVKLGEASQSVTIHILLDRSRSMHWDAAAALAEDLPRRTFKWDAARRLAGALSYLALTGGERLVLTPFAQQLDPSLGPTQGKRQIVPTLRFLSDLTPSGSFKKGEAGLAQTLKRYADTHPGGGLLIIISDLLNAAVSIEAGAAAQHLAEGLRSLPGPTWQVIVMHLLTAQELDPAFTGDVDLHDLESGDRAPFRLDEETLTQYRLRVKRWCGELQQASTRRGAVYARLLAEWPFEQTVVPYLRRRGVF